MHCEQPSVPNPVHVLVVDDEPILREEIVEYLTVRGMRAEAVDSGQAALVRLAEDMSISVILTDVKMPKMDGLTLAQQAIEQRPEEFALEIVVMTGHGTVGDAAAALRLRAIDFITKPARLSTIEGAIGKAAKQAMRRRTDWQLRQTEATKLATATEELGAVKALVDDLRNRLRDLPPDRQLETAARDAFLAVIGHELKTPLHPIIGFSELIENGFDRLSADQIKAFAHEIAAGGQRLDRTLSRIADMASLSAKACSAKRRPCMLGSIAQAVLRTHSAAIAEREQTLSLTIVAEDKCDTDAGWLTKLLDELIDNASRFSPTGATIQFSIFRDRADYVFEIWDSGPGMTAAELDIVQQPFRQLDMSLTRPYEGLGIGLSMAHDIAKLLGGHLTLTSKPGAGTTAVLRLPIAQQPAV